MAQELSKAQDSAENQVEDVNKTTPKTSEPEYSATELLAMEKGWKPKDQLEDGKPFVDADEFLRRGELFDKIKSLKDELHAAKKDITALAEHHAKVRENEFKRAVEYLKNQKKEALVEGDANKVVEIDEQLARVREAQRQTIQPKQEAVNEAIKAMHTQFIGWVEQNAWYNQNEELHNFADATGLRLSREDPSLTYQQVLARTASEVKKRYPEYFQGGPKKLVPPSPDGNNSTSKSKVEAAQKGKLRESDLTDEEARVMKVLIQKIPGFTKEKYLSDLAAVKGV